jgi:DNA (cytosine-5)-methyltransferase 1
MSLASLAGRATTKNFRVVSYFAGCGGLDLGFLGGFDFKGAQFKRQPFEVVRAYDFDERCVETYKLNISDHIEVADLTEISPDAVPSADVLIGGFPCQDFSSCGPKKGLTSARGKLYRSLVNYMAHHRPFVVVGENVPHIARMHSGDVMKRIIRDLEAVGYRVCIWDLYAPDFGVPQNRSRLFFVCVRDDLSGAPTPPAIEYQADKYRSIDWAIADLMPVSDETVPNQSQYFLASKAKKGNGQGDEKSKKGQPAYTVRANAKSRVQFHYGLDRRLTVRECARLQTFPDDFVFPHSATTNVMQVGNAVPPVLAYKVALSVASFLRASVGVDDMEANSVLVGNY